MGVLIFAFRKIFLKRRMNQLNARGMQLSNIKMRLTDQIARINKAKASTMNAFNSMMQNIASQNSSIFQAQMGGFNSSLDTFEKGYKTALANSGNDMNSSAVKLAQTQWNSAKDLVNTSTQGLFMNYNMANQQVQMKSNLMAQAIQASDDAELERLTAQNTSIDTENESNSSQLKQMSAEYDEVEKAETDAAKKDAPKFGV